MNYFRIRRKLIDGFVLTNTKDCRRRARLIDKLKVKQGIQPLTFGQLCEAHELDREIERFEGLTGIDPYKLKSAKAKLRSMLYANIS